MTVRSAVLFKVISVLSVATSIQCSASRASSVGLHINTANGLLANEQYFAVGLLTMLAFFLVARVSIKYGVTTGTWMVSGPRQTTAAPEDFSTLVRHQAQVIEEPPVLPGFSIDIAHSPIRNSSGDFYQSIRLQGQHEGSILIVIGDVSGCGGRTSAAVAEIVRTVRALAVDFRGPGALLAQLNSRIGGCLCGESATCLALFLTPDGNCTVASAGHPWPVVNGRELALESGLPLGLLSESEFPEKHLILREYDYLALYTNGLLEARNQ